MMPASPAGTPETEGPGRHVRRPGPGLLRKLIRQAGLTVEQFDAL